LLQFLSVGSKYYIVSSLCKESSGYEINEYSRGGKSVLVKAGEVVAKFVIVDCVDDDEDDFLEDDAQDVKQ
jgi:hypothetical protein